MISVLAQGLLHLHQYVASIITYCFHGANWFVSQNVSQQVFQIRAVVDDLPEDNEHYTVTLTSADGGATLNAARATIFIRLNGDANGIVSIDPKSQYLVLHESGLGSTGSGTVQYVTYHQKFVVL